MSRTQFPGLSIDAFIADTDLKALKGLQKVPLVPQLISKYHEVGIDRWMYCWNMGTSVRCGPSQYPTLYKILQECCLILDMPEPELYISNNPFPNAFAGGIDRPYINVRSSMIDTLDDEGLYHLIGHELGHIKAGHILYMSTARSLLSLLELFGRRFVGISDAAQIAVAAAFFEWMRQAEVTADRAGLLCAQQLDISTNANLHLTGGPNRLAHEANLDAFMDQARSYSDMDFLDGVGKMIIFLNYGLFTTHPMPVHRVQQLERWFYGGEYDSILSGNYKRKSA